MTVLLCSNELGNLTGTGRRSSVHSRLREVVVVVQTRAIDGHEGIDDEWDIPRRFPL